MRFLYILTGMALAFAPIGVLARAPGHHSTFYKSTSQSSHNNHSSFSSNQLSGTPAHGSNAVALSSSASQHQNSNSNAVVSSNSFTQNLVNVMIDDPDANLSYDVAQVINSTASTTIGSSSSTSQTCSQSIPGTNFCYGDVVTIKAPNDLYITRQTASSAGISSNSKVNFVPMSTTSVPLPNTFWRLDQIGDEKDHYVALIADNGKYLCRENYVFDQFINSKIVSVDTLVPDVARCGWTFTTSSFYTIITYESFSLSLGGISSSANTHLPLVYIAPSFLSAFFSKLFSKSGSNFIVVKYPWIPPSQLPILSPSNVQLTFTENSVVRLVIVKSTMLVKATTTWLPQAKYGNIIPYAANVSYLFGTSTNKNWKVSFIGKPSDGVISLQTNAGYLGHCKFPTGYAACTIPYSISSAQIPQWHVMAMQDGTFRLKSDVSKQYLSIPFPTPDGTIFAAVLTFEGDPSIAINEQQYGVKGLSPVKVASMLKDVTAQSVDPRFSNAMFQCNRKYHIIDNNDDLTVVGCHQITDRNKCLHTEVVYGDYQINCEWDSGVCHPGCGCGYPGSKVRSGHIVGRPAMFICDNRQWKPGDCARQLSRDTCLASKVSYGPHDIDCEVSLFVFTFFH